eukprot:363869-Chlamydomonas_euryale.AAC.32
MKSTKWGNPTSPPLRGKSLWNEPQAAASTLRWPPQSLVSPLLRGSGMSFCRSTGYTLGSFLHGTGSKASLCCKVHEQA